MSRNEWEHGTIKLPAAEFAKVRRAVQAADQQHRQAMFDAAQRFWKSLSRKEQTDRVACRAAAHQFCYDPANPVPEGTPTVLSRGLRGDKPTRVLRSDMNFPTNRTVRFDAGDEATVYFDRERRTVTWDVPSNNHAVESARQSPVGQALFAALDRVRWTHGTGGVIVGNDEYNQDANDVGGGGNYCTGAYGYVGIAEQPTHVGPFTNGKGQHVEVEVKMGRYGWVGKAVTGKPRTHRPAYTAW